MARQTFKGYMDNIQIKTGKTAEDFWKLVSKKGFVKRGEVVAKHSEMLCMAQIKGDWIGARARKLHHTISPIAHW